MNITFVTDRQDVAAALCSEWPEHDCMLYPRDFDGGVDDGPDGLVVWIEFAISREWHNSAHHHVGWHPTDGVPKVKRSVDEVLSMVRGELMAIDERAEDGH